MWSKLPGPGSKIRTEQGVYILESIDVGSERVNIRCPTGRLLPILISEFPDFKETVLKGEEWGEDKEFAAKKKAAQERIAAIKARAQRLKSRSRTAAAKNSSAKVKQAAPVKAVKQKAKPNKPVNRDNTPKNRKKPKKQ